MPFRCNRTQLFFGYRMFLPQYSITVPTWLVDLYMYLTPVYLVVGTIGNFLSIVVFLRPAMKSFASGSRFILISIIDVIVLYGCLFPIFLHFGKIFNICNLQIEFFNIWIQLSLIMIDSWVLALATLERTLAIFRPLSTWTSNEKRKRCCSWINATFIALPFVSLFLNLPSLFMPIIEWTRLSRFYHVLTYVNSVISKAVPFVLMLCLDIAIMIKLYGSPFSGFKNEGEKTKRERNNGWLSRKKMLRALKKKTETPAGNSVDDEEANRDEVVVGQNAKKKTGSGKRAGSSHVSAGSKSTRSRALQSLKMILAVDMVAILLNCPMIAGMIIRKKNETLLYAARLAIFTRHAINFFFYFIGSKFRRETIAVLCCRFRRPVPGRASTTSVSVISSS